MGGKSTLILDVDLSCCECKRKIQKLLCKIQDQENIKEIAYDEEKNKVTISGPFDPRCLQRKLYCQACKIIKIITIPPPPPSPPPTPPPPPPERKCTCTCVCVCPPGPVCCGRPCNVGMYGGMKCASCGMVYTWTKQCPPTVNVCHQPLVPLPYYGCGESKTCHYVYEDNTSQCTIM